MNKLEAMVDEVIEALGGTKNHPRLREALLRMDLIAFADLRMLVSQMDPDRFAEIAARQGITGDDPAALDRALARARNQPMVLHGDAEPIAVDIVRAVKEGAGFHGLDAGHSAGGAFWIRAGRVRLDFEIVATGSRILKSDDQS